MALRVPSFVKPALLKFKQAELEHANSQPSNVKAKLAKGEDFETARNHIRFYGDVAFTLAGVKPCALFAHGTVPQYTTGVAQKCLAPLLQELNSAGAGFVVEQIKHPLKTSDPTHPGFQGAWLLYNTLHPLYSLVKDTFLVPQSGPVDEEQIGRALGYPLPIGDARVGYVDLTESRENDVCCVPVARFSCPEVEGYTRLIEHFEVYREVWEALGRELSIDVDDHPRFKAALIMLKGS